MEVTTWFSQDQLKGDNSTELRVKFIRRLEEAVPVGEDWFMISRLYIHHSCFPITLIYCYNKICTCSCKRL